MSRIQHKRAHHARLAIKLTSESATVGNTHVIPCYEPKMAGPDGTQIDYNAMRDVRAASPGAVNMVHRKFSDKIPLFLPYSTSEVASLTSLFEKILSPAGMDKTSILVGGGEEADGSKFISSDLASADNYKSAVLCYEEVKSREIMALCQSEFSINLDTAGACELAYEFMGSDAGIFDYLGGGNWTPAMNSATCQTELFSYPSIVGVKPVFRNAEFLITPLDDSISDYLAVKTYNFTMGNQLALRDDGCAENGIAGVSLGGLLTNQSHKMSVEMPAGHSSFPYQTYFKEGTLLKYTITLLGNSTGRFGIRLKGVLKVNTAVDRGERNNIRTIDITGVGVQGNDMLPPFEFIIGGALT